MIFRHTKGWLWVHITLQTVGSLIVLFMAGWILSDPLSDMNAPNVPPHAYLGFVLIGLIVIQLLLGTLNQQRLQSEKLASIAGKIRWFHDWIGRFMIVAGFVQIGLGVNVLWPMVSGVGGPGVGIGHPVWAGYLVGVAGWVVIFVIAEVGSLSARRSSNSF